MTAPAIRPVHRVAAPPSEAAFGPEEFLEDPALDALYQALIGDFPDTHGHLETASVKLLWKAKGGKSKGRARFGAWEDGEDGEDGKFLLIGHDLEVFVSEIEDFGNWHDLMAEAASAFEQAPLFED